VVQFESYLPDFRRLSSLHSIWQLAALVLARNFRLAFLAKLLSPRLTALKATPAPQRHRRRVFPLFLWSWRAILNLTR
jgi:hypothetical protein